MIASTAASAAARVLKRPVTKSLDILSAPLTTISLANANAEAGSQQWRCLLHVGLRYEALLDHSDQANRNYQVVLGERGYLAARPCWCQTQNSRPNPKRERSNILMINKLCLRRIQLLEKPL